MFCGFGGCGSSFFSSLSHSVWIAIHCGSTLWNSMCSDFNISTNVCFLCLLIFITSLIRTVSPVWQRACSSWTIKFLCLATNRFVFFIIFIRSHRTRTVFCIAVLTTRPTRERGQVPVDCHDVWGKKKTGGGLANISGRSNTSKPQEVTRTEELRVDEGNQENTQSDATMQKTYHCLVGLGSGGHNGR